MPLPGPCRAVPGRIGSDRSGAAPGGGRSSAAPARSPQRGRSRLARSPPGAALVHPPSSFCGLAAPHDRPQVSERRSPGPRGEAAAPEGAREARGLPPGPRRLSTPRPPFRGVRGVKAREAARAGTAAGLRRLKRPGLAPQACGRLRRGGCCPLMLKLLRKCRAGGVRSLLRGLKLAPSVGACAMDVVWSRSPVVANFLTL